jgi:hypothetical protein
MTYSVCLGSLMRCLPMIGTAQSAWLRIVFVASFLWSGPAFAPDDAIASPGPNSRTGDTRAARPGACSRQSTRCARAVRAAVSAAGVAPCSVATSAKREPATAGSPATSHDATGLDGSPSAERRCAHRAVAPGRARLSAGQRRCETSRQQARSAFNGAESGVLSGGRKLA